jgi:coenzyme F420-reducing hydrogenase beta subunit
VVEVKVVAEVTAEVEDVEVGSVIVPKEYATIMVVKVVLVVMEELVE